MKEAVLLLAHGTPDVLGEMAEYLKRVTGGRALPLEVVEELQHRYGEIGLGWEPGVEAPPLTKWTMTQGYLLEQALKAKVYVGMRNWHPFIGDVVGQMRADGVTRIKALCLAPQNSRTSVGLYRKAVMEAAGGDGGGVRDRVGGASAAGGGVCGEDVAGLGGGLRGDRDAGSGAVYGALGALPDDLDGVGFGDWGEAGDAGAEYARSLSGGGEADGADGGGPAGRGWVSGE